MRTPVIGITGRQTNVRDEFPETLGHLRSDVFITAYADCVTAAGGIPLWLSRTADPAALAAALDGFVIGGGQDVDPRLYGSVPDRHSTVLDPARDEFECELVRAAVHAGRPVLGICRGNEVINVAFGGTLRGDLALGVGESHGFLGYPAAHRSHAVTLAEGSLLARLLGPAAAVNSYHHQSVDKLGAGLVATAHAPDGVIEGVERPGTDLLGVQWHPEMLDGPDPVFDWLVGRCSTGDRTYDGSEIHRAIA
ncbi:gamma-glutamyl-gamma-aminobutyrate hydrolase family protein [Actinomadura madurae]|uniref:gamma-glutamyl-gamma-aminobutyrate hydrolase family protein n=1 Tax=Actinomadura madurae TaxID=1993 RepID=UPI00399B398E